MTEKPREQQIRERLEGITSGPWVTKESRHGPEGEPFIAIRGEIDGASYITVAQLEEIEADPAAPRDAEFIARAREDIPFLLGEIDRLRVVVEAASWWHAAVGPIPDDGYHADQEVALSRAIDAYQEGRAEAVER